MKTIIKKILRILPDKIYLKIKYYIRFKKKLNLHNPETYNEKIQWLKLYDRKKIYTTMVDKYEVKNYVANIIGEEYIIPTIGVFNKFDEINFDSLPNQFVIKCTHDSCGLIIVKNKKELDIKKARKKINKCLKNNYFFGGREWPYKNVKPRIIIEPYLEEKKYGELRDYKFFTFSGKVKFMFIASNRQGNGDTYFDFYDEKFNHLDIINGHSNNPTPPEKPLNFNKMIELAEKLSKNIKHVRIDFYEVDGKIYFGEMTFYHWSGFVPFSPEKWDKIIGSYIKI
mgnify:CR=1 FL=1